MDDGILDNIRYIHLSPSPNRIKKTTRQRTEIKLSFIVNIFYISRQL